MPSLDDQKKNYIFGYGSLVSRESIQETLKHEPGPLHPATLKGWLRDWGIVLDNSSTIRRFELLPDRSVPRYVVALNVRKPRAGETATNPNGVLFEVSDQDIKNMDERENHYERINVTNDIDTDAVGNIYVYVGLEKYETLEECKDEVILPLSYLRLVERGFNSIGDTNAELFRRTTAFPDIESKETLHTSSLNR